MDADRQDSAARNRATWLTVGALAAILAVALGLRLYGLAWDEGFDWTPHPDERAILSKTVQLSFPEDDLGSLFDAERSTWNPRWFPYGSMPLYALAVVRSAASTLTGAELHDLRLMARAISALADVATVAMVFVLGARVYGRGVGLLAAALTALAVLHVQLSHFFAVDTLAALFSVAALFFLYRVARHGRLSDSVLAGVLIGLGLATKVSLFPIVAAYGVAHLMHVMGALEGASDRSKSFTLRLPSALWGAVAGAAAVAAVLALTQPYALLDWQRFLADVTEQSEMVRRIRDYPYTRQYVDTTPYLYHAQQLATWGLGWPLGVAALAGLAYAAVRGMRPAHGVAYLAAGWAAPAAMLLTWDGVLAIAAASAVALAALLVTLAVRSASSRVDVLLLSWVVPYLLITGAFEVKFLRYLLPVTPFLLLFGSRMLYDLWRQAGEWRGGEARPLASAAIAIVVGATALYALAYVAGVYGQPLTSVRAGEWVRENVPRGSVILKEHWEEGLPRLRGYDIRELEMYNPDGARKQSHVAERLAEADYLVLYSNRLYGTISRLPERYPLSREYYRLLFSGQLGYDIRLVETSYPNLLGVGLVDDTFGRAGLSEPLASREQADFPFTLRLGYADESFTVYDHPKVFVLENVGRFDSTQISALLDGLPAPVAPPVSGVQDAGEPDGVRGLVLSPEDAATQQAGGTWREIIDTNSWANRVPVLAWLVVIEGLSLLALPAALLLFRPLPDRGYLLVKTLALLAACLVVWLLASLRWMAFSQGAIVVAALTLAAVSFGALTLRGGEIRAFVRERWRLIVICEALFLAAFLAFVLLRMANPDLWHPFRGGEKPMDFAYLNAVVRSTVMPPYDPWFGGGYLNYYYWGQFIVATLIRATGIQPAVAYNLAVPTFFALAVGGAFSVVYNLAASALRPAGVATRAVFRRPSGVEWSAVAAGLGGAVFVCVLGNLDGAAQIVRGGWRWLESSAPFGFDYWRSTRMMPPDPPGHEITEFPFFSFLFADLHAHMMAIPFALLAIGLSLSVVLAARRFGAIHERWEPAELARLVVLGVVVGALWLINAWDYPTQLMLAGAAILLAEYLAQGGLGLTVLVRAAFKSLLVFVVGYAAFLPFHLNYETFVGGVEATTNTTTIWQFLAISGLFVFVIGSFALMEARSLVSGLRPPAAVTSLFRLRDGVGRRQVVVPALAALAAALLAVVALSDEVGGTVPLVLALLALTGGVCVARLVALRGDAAQVAFAGLLACAALALVLGLEFVRVQDDIDRMNSVFKFYLQAWTLMALASAYLLWRIVTRWRASESRRVSPAVAWAVVLAALVLCAAVYPVLGTRARLADRFDTNAVALTLDGAEYVRGTVYRDREGPIDLDADFEGIRWLLENVDGSPITLEGQTPLYRWGGRVSVYTGLPGVVGWEWHQIQQRGVHGREVSRRVDDVDTIYSTRSPQEAARLLRKYDVSYVYVGQLERLYYPEEGIRKFDDGMAGVLERVYAGEQAAIYRVVQ